MKCNKRSLALFYLFRPCDLLFLITTIIAVFKHLLRYASSSSSGLRPSQRRSESELPPPPPPEEIAAGVPPARASAMANIFERREGFASWSSIVSNVDFKPSLFSISVLTSVNGNGKCTDFGNRECSDFGNNNAPISVTTIHNFR